MLQLAQSVLFRSWNIFLHTNCSLCKAAELDLVVNAVVDQQGDFPEAGDDGTAGTFVFFEGGFLHNTPCVFVLDCGVAKQHDSSLSMMFWDLNCILLCTFISS